MASAIYNSFFFDVAKGSIDCDTDTFKMLLVTATYSPNVDTHAKRSDVTNEVANGNGYTTGGATLSGFTTGSSGTTAWIDFTTDPTWATATITARGALIYNSSVSNKAVAVLDFGSDITSTAGTFTVTFPTADASNALIRLA
jgi:hypothetical protein